MHELSTVEHWAHLAAMESFLSDSINLDIASGKSLFQKL